MVELLTALPEFAERIPAEDLERANGVLRCQTLTVTRGRWQPPETPDPVLGFVVVEGFLIRQVERPLGGSAELVGPGDILRPWDDETASGIVAVEASWQALTDVQLAVLDTRRLTPALAHWPALLDALMSRLMRRSRRLADVLAIAELVRVDDRVLALLWHVADLWGRVTALGVQVPVPLTHAAIARLIGAQRPSASTAISRLRVEGRLTRGDDGSWLLHGDPPSAKG